MGRRQFFETGVIRVRRSLEQRRGGQCSFKEPKTKKSRRSVPLTADGAQLRKAHRVEQNNVRLALGGGYNDSGLVFPDPETGEAWCPIASQCCSTIKRRRRAFESGSTVCVTLSPPMVLWAHVPMKTVSQMLGAHDDGHHGRPLHSRHGRQHA